MANAPEPKPTLLASLGVGPSPAQPPVEELSSRAEGEADPTETDVAATETPGAIAERQEAAEFASPRRKTAEDATAGVRSTSKAGGSPRRQARLTEDDNEAASPAVDAALHAIREKHRTQRAAGAKSPLAPLNVDVPIDLLRHIRILSADIPYPLRRLAEEALELWLVATNNTQPPSTENRP